MFDDIAYTISQIFDFIGASTVQGKLIFFGSVLGFATLIALFEFIHSRNM